MDLSTFKSKAKDSTKETREQVRKESIRLAGFRDKENTNITLIF